MSRTLSRASSTRLRPRAWAQEACKSFARPFRRFYALPASSPLLAGSCGQPLARRRFVIPMQIPQAQSRSQVGRRRPAFVCDFGSARPASRNPDARQRTRLDTSEAAFAVCPQGHVSPARQRLTAPQTLPRHAPVARVETPPQNVILKRHSRLRKWGGKAASPSAKARVAPSPPRRRQCPARSSP